MQIHHVVFLGSSLVLLQAGIALGATIVPGSANPNLAGRADGYSCCNGDSAPGQSPPLVVGEIGSCDTLIFEATGKVSFSGTITPGNNPDGDSAFDMSNFGDGISAPTQVRTNALFGVFLDEDSPTGESTPARLSFPNKDFIVLSPEIGQIFFIGDGLTSDSNAGQSDGSPQLFLSPSGATRLFLGTGDGSGWFNNSGSFSVDVTRFANDADHACGDPLAPVGVTASDALGVLRAAVGTLLCQKCVCDVDRSGTTAATDALKVLRHAVGQDVEIRCDCCPAIE